MIDYSELVHLDPVSGRWVVAEYRDGRYYAPMTDASRKATGAMTVFGSLNYCLGNAYSAIRRADALRAARKVYGDYD